MNYDLLCPAVILVPVTCSFQVIVFVRPPSRRGGVPGDVTVGEHLLHTVLPLVPVFGRQMVTISDFANVRIFFHPN